jgi:hypothetical protein
MGGKGGGGGQTTSWDVKDPTQQAYYKPLFEANRKDFANEADWYANAGGAKNKADTRTPGGYVDPWMQSMFTELYGAAPPAAAAVPAADTPTPVAPEPEKKPDDPVVTPAAADPAPTPVDPGGAIDQPTGDVLGGSILNPPKYWVGGIDSYKKGPSTKSSSLTTTQT